MDEEISAWMRGWDFNERLLIRIFQKLISENEWKTEGMELYTLRNELLKMEILKKKKKKKANKYSWDSFLNDEFIFNAYGAAMNNWSKWRMH